MSDINSLRAELSRQQSINRELLGELNELYSGLNQADKNLSSFRQHVAETFSDSNNKIENSYDRTLRAYEVQGEIDKMYVRFKHIELANKRIRECNNKIFYDFANYRTVRKIVQGMMDNMNVNMVSDATIYKSVERQHLQTPDYWLTCVLISVMAWKSDDKELADRAMIRALRLDKKSSSIFYMLFNLRVGRENAALKWFYVYQECDLRGSDEETFLMLFSLVSSTMGDTVDDHTKSEISLFIKKVINAEAESAGFSEQDMFDLIEERLRAMRHADDMDFSALRRCCDDYRTISDTVMLAKNNQNILQFVLDVENVSECERNAYLSSFIEREIAAPNAVEKQVYDDIELCETIIRYKGEKEEAESAFETLQSHRASELDLISRMIRWIYGRELEDDSGQLRKNMFTLTVHWQIGAAEQYAADYRAGVTKLHPITLGDYKTTADFGNLAGEKSKVETYCVQKRDALLAAVKNLSAYIGFGAAAAAAVGAFFAGPFLFLLTGIGAIYGGVKLLLNSHSRKQINSDYQLEVGNKQELLDRLFREYAQLDSMYLEYDAVHEQVTQELNRF